MNVPLEKFQTNPHNFKHAPKCHLLLKVLNMSFQPTPKKTALSNSRSDGVRTKKDLSYTNGPSKVIKIVRHTKSVSQDGNRAYKFEWVAVLLTYFHCLLKVVIRLYNYFGLEYNTLMFALIVPPFFPVSKLKMALTETKMAIWKMLVQSILLK